MHRYVTLLNCHDQVIARQVNTGLNSTIAHGLARMNPGYRVRVEKAEKPLSADLLIPFQSEEITIGG